MVIALAIFFRMTVAAIVRCDKLFGIKHAFLITSSLFDVFNVLDYELSNENGVEGRQ